ncbi:MAG: TetR/AcrR family transcriptional regulator [Gammaproteobacteria bacterium]|nr:TetR/AcrR family transcriptional regulator [Gammaproteobacteria bacterium]
MPETEDEYLQTPAGAAPPEAGAPDENDRSLPLTAALSPGSMGKPGKHKSTGGGRRSGIETQRAFVDVATRLFAEHGYNGTSIADIANELGLTTASLYYHVTGKQELLLHVLATGMAEFLNRLEEIAAQEIDPREKLRLAIDNHLSFVLSKKQAVAVFLRERRFLESPYKEQYQQAVDRYDVLFTEIVSKCMAQGAIPSGDPTLIRLGILGMINWIVEWYQPDGRLKEDEIRLAFTGIIVDQMLSL